MRRSVFNYHEKLKRRRSRLESVVTRSQRKERLESRIAEFNAISQQAEEASRSAKLRRAKRNYLMHKAYPGMQVAKLRKLGKPIVLFAVTPNGWAYDLRCQALMEHLKSFYICDKQSINFARRYSHNYDAVYVAGFEAVKKNITGCICTTIGGLVTKSMDEAISIVKRAKAVAVPNLTWYNEFQERVSKTYPHEVKVYYIPNGVDTIRFAPSRYRNEGEFVVGWVGNDSSHRLKIKRIDILRNTCKKLHVKLVERNWKHNNIPHEDMHKFYRGIDLCVNVSTTEGSNNPILEACSTAIPVLGTPVGNVPELTKAGVVSLRPDLKDLADKIMMFKEMPSEKRHAIGAKLREHMIQEYDWKRQAMRYHEMFESCVKK